MRFHISFQPSQSLAAAVMLRDLKQFFPIPHQLAENEIKETQFLKFESLFFFYKFIYLFMASLGLRCCVRAFFSCRERGYSSLRCTGFLLRWLLLLRSTGSRHEGSVVVARGL